MKIKEAMLLWNSNSPDVIFVKHPDKFGVGRNYRKSSGACWMHLGEGVRDWQPDASLGKKGAQPSPDHKRGFSIKFYNKEMGLAEWSANGTGPNMGLEKLWKAIEAGQAANSDKLPVIEYKGSTLEKIGKGTTRIPNFDVVSWIARPAGMDAVDDGTQSFDSDGKISMATPTPAPALKAAPKTAMAQAVEDDEMF